MDKKPVSNTMCPPSGTDMSSSIHVMSSGAQVNFSLPPSGGSVDTTQVSAASTFWRDMLNVPATLVNGEPAMTSQKTGLDFTLPSMHGTNTMFMAMPGVHSQSLPSNAMAMNLTNSTYSSASSPPPPPRVYKPCAVCSDKASGYHYGVCSCEGCKGFFRRSVQRSMEYVCHKDKQCVINKLTRNRCQYCRLQKCYEKGMSKEAVRNDRHKRKKQKEEEVAITPTSSVSEEMSKEEEELLDGITMAHEETFLMVSSGNNTDLAIKLDRDVSSGILWERVQELSTNGIVQIVKFGKSVPGFSSLSVTDQITLLKAACLEILILRLCSRFNEKNETVTLSNNLTLTREQLERGGFGSLTGAIIKFAQCMQQYELDKTEYAMLCAICLLSGDRSGLEQPEKIEKLQEPLLEALKHYVRQRRPTSAHSFAKMLMKLSDLRGISVKGAEKVLKLRAETSTELPPLIVEMLDRTENVSIPT